MADAPARCPSCKMAPSAGRHANYGYCDDPCHNIAAPALPGAAPDPVAGATALDALLREVAGASKWITSTTDAYLARTAAPRLAAIVRVYDQIARAWARSVSGEGTCPLCRKARWGAATRPHHANCPAVVMSHALARAEAIAKGE